MKAMKSTEIKMKRGLLLYVMENKMRFDKNRLSYIIKTCETSFQFYYQTQSIAVTE